MTRTAMLVVCLVGVCLFAVATTQCTVHRHTTLTGGENLRGSAASATPQENPLTLPREFQGTLVASQRSRPLPLERVKSSPPGATPASLSLTAADGTGLKLVSLRARAVIEGPLAFTELHLSFRNPEPRELEGRFQITLPDEAALSRFAMKIGEHWQEGEVVERRAAQEAYESFLHRRQDPALLEKKAGNEFSARIFPIPAGGEKEIKLSYSQELRAAGAAYQLPLKGLPRMEQLELAALVGGLEDAPRASSLGGALRQVVKVTRKDYIPDQDFVVPLPRAAGGLRHQNLVVARVRPELPASEVELGSLLVLLDTSASRAAGLAAQVEGLGALLKRLASIEGPALPIEVVCFDQSVESVYRGGAGGFGEPHRRRILDRLALGASNLAGALGWAARRGGFRRVLLLTDGVATAGRTSGADLREAVSQLGPTVKRLDVLLVGGIRDQPLMRRLTRGTLREDGAVLDGDQPSERLARALRQPTFSGIEVEVPGARWVWPSSLDGVQPGDEHLIYVDLPRAAGALSLRLSCPIRDGLDGRPPRRSESAGAPRIRKQLRVPLAAVERPLLERAWVKAKIARLTARMDTLAASARPAAVREIVELSTRFRVLSDYTALLVLETEWDYQRFNLERRAVADILAVGPAGLEVLQRSPPAPTGAPFPRRAARSSVLGRLGSAGGSQIASIFGRDAPLGADAEDALGGLIGNTIGESYGVGGLGLPGTGRGGGGLGISGTGRGGGRIGYSGGGGDSARAAAMDAARSGGVLGLLKSTSAGGASSAPIPARIAITGFGRATATRRIQGAPTVTQGTASVSGALDRELIRRVVRQHLNELRYCFQRELQTKPGLAGRVVVYFTIAGTGQVMASAVSSSTLGNPAVESCLAAAVRRWAFPKPRGGGIVLVRYPFLLGTGPELASMRRSALEDEPPAEGTKAGGLSPAERLKKVTNLIAAGRVEEGLRESLRWRVEDPGDTLALCGLGEALQARGQLELAARAYGSLIDLYPSRADLRRFAGARLEALGEVGLALAADTYSVALEQRPDHLTGYRLLAYALVRQGKLARAFATLERGLRRELPGGRFEGGQRVLREDLGIVAAAWLRSDRAREGELTRRLARAGASLARAPSLRFVLSWETDTNDVDLHVHDGKGNHAFYGERALRTGGALYHDVTTGYGPECFAIDGKPLAFPYRLKVHYFARGPMGFGMGKVAILQHDGAGTLRFQDRPFVIVDDRAEVSLGALKAPLRY